MLEIIKTTQDKLLVTDITGKFIGNKIGQFNKIYLAEKGVFPIQKILIRIQHRKFYWTPFFLTQSPDCICYEAVEDALIAILNQGYRVYSFAGKGEFKKYIKSYSLTKRKK